MVSLFSLPPPLGICDGVSSDLSSPGPNFPNLRISSSLRPICLPTAAVITLPKPPPPNMLLMMFSGSNFSLSCFVFSWRDSVAFCLVAEPNAPVTEDFSPERIISAAIAPIPLFFFSGFRISDKAFFCARSIFLSSSDSSTLIAFSAIIFFFVH